ncbi:hypothetical protein EDB86DRAFT_2831226 [Lactarius hatsudake]|nr:hypothetical protein EDB86DRAFT_2831226 [Lactarius hatsudake]
MYMGHPLWGTITWFSTSTVQSIPNDLTSVQGVAASKPLLSEAASYIMRKYNNFNLPNALLNILDSYAISHRDWGELLVAAFFTSAWDLYVLLKQPKLFSNPFRHDIITCPYLLTIMAHGTVALGANCQPGFDMVYPYLYETSDLVVKNVG